jgi:hypothetical protein
MSAKPKDWPALAAQYEEALTRSSLRKLARELGVSEDSLTALGAGWREEDEAWTFPERDGDSNIIGILRRFEDGAKQVIRGSKRGLYLPKGWDEHEGVIYLPEGPSDVAALLSMGMRAIGRPCCAGGVDHLVALLADSDADDILVVGENDAKDDGTWPGRDGARKLASTLARDLDARVRWTMPPKGCKDVREWLNKESDDGE